MRVIVSIKDVGTKKFIEKEIAYITKLAEEDTKRCAEVTTEVIREEIKGSITRQGSTGNLEKGFFEGKVPGGWGVGDIEYLNANVPHWRHVNYGSEAIGANWKHWLPKGKFVNERWVADPDGYWMMPTKPIPPANFIERTIAKIDSIINRVLNEKRG